MESSPFGHKKKQKKTSYTFMCPTPYHTHYSTKNSDTGYRTVPRNISSTADLSADPALDDYAPQCSHLPSCPAFAQIGALRGPFDLGLIPIGAYEPRWLFSNVHANSKDAVNIFVDTKCNKALGMHWGTWVLTEEEIMEPPQKLKEACKWKGVDEARFEVCGIWGDERV